MVGSASTFHYLGIPTPHRYNGIFSLSKTACVTCCTRCCYTNNLFCPATSQLKWPRFHLWIIHRCTQSHTNPKLPNAPCTHEQWCRCGHTLQLLDIHKETQIQMDTHPCECSRMQKKKNTHTRVWCPSFYSLSLSPSLSGVSLWSYDTLLLLLLFYACGDASLLMWILYIWFMYDSECMLIFVCIAVVFLDIISSSLALCSSTIRVCDPI